MIATSRAQEQAWKAMEWDMKSQNIVEFASKGSSLDFALVLIFAVVLAPLFEEMVFRVHLYSGLRTRMGPAPAAVLSAALFALVHLEPVAFPVTFLLGLCLAYLRERTGGRSAPIAMHACYNAFQMAGILAIRFGGGPTTGG
jgi:membrane protease YdiL (CAAX protease family)